MARALQPLNERDFEVLGDLMSAVDSNIEYKSQGYNVRLWQRPLDVGGSSNNDTSPRLNKLAKRGLVEFRQRSAHMSRGSKEYMITDAGRAAFQERRNT